MPSRFSQLSLSVPLAELLPDLLGPELITFNDSHGTLVVSIYPDSIVRVITILRDHPRCDFRQLIDITAVDYPSHPERFEIIYNLLSHKYNKRLHIKIHTNEENTVNSITSVFKCANWYEREVWDLFGIPFNNHPDLRRILTDYDFAGHPLRKDFPLSGYVQVRYDGAEQRVIQEPLHLDQPYRDFNFLSPWEAVPCRTNFVGENDA